jgi:phage shock protein E
MDIDVRTAEEFGSDYHHERCNIPLDRIMAGDLGRLASVAHDVPIMVWCRSGARAGVAVEILKSAGFKSVVNGHMTGNEAD